MMGKNAYFTKDVADNLEIVTSTLRKYCLLLERAGYKFDRNEKEQRIFYDRDLVILRRLKQYTMDSGMTLENAVKEVISRVEKASEALGDDMGYSEIPDTTRYNALEAKLDQLLDYVRKQEEYIKKQDERIEAQERFNRELIARLEDQQRYIAESLNKRDQQLTSAIRELQEAPKLIVAAKEREIEAERRLKELEMEKAKPRGLWKWFKK